MRKTLGILLFLLNLSSSVQAQSLDETFQIAELHFDDRNFQAAIDAYTRVYFFDKENEIGIQTDKIADCYFEIGDFENAEKYYEISYFQATDDSLRLEMLFKKTNSLLYQKKFKFALLELFNLHDDLNPYFEKKKNLLTGIAHYGNLDFEQAFDSFENYILEEEKQSLKELAGLQKKLQKKERMNPKTARWLSVAFPGLGQVYAGDVVSGLNSLGVTIALGALFLNVRKNRSLLEATILVFPWFQRYYAGGFAAAETIAKQKKTENRAIIFDEIMEILDRDISK